MVYKPTCNWGGPSCSETWILFPTSKRIVTSMTEYDQYRHGIFFTNSICSLCKLWLSHTQWPAMDELSSIQRDTLMSPFWVNCDSPLEKIWDLYTNCIERMLCLAEEGGMQFGCDGKLCIRHKPSQERTVFVIVNLWTHIDMTFPTAPIDSGTGWQRNRVACQKFGKFCAVDHCGSNHFEVPLSWYMQQPLESIFFSKRGCIARLDPVQPQGDRLASRKGTRLAFIMWP